MLFNETNSVENYIIHILTGVNLNSKIIDSNSKIHKWLYKSQKEVNHKLDEVLLFEDVREALIRLNPEIKKKKNIQMKLFIN